MNGPYSSNAADAPAPIGYWDGSSWQGLDTTGSSASVSSRPAANRPLITAMVVFTVIAILPMIILFMVGGYLGSQSGDGALEDATGDVTVSSAGTRGFGNTAVDVAVTNGGNETYDYVVILEEPSTNKGEAGVVPYVYFDNVGPGQTAEAQVLINLELGPGEEFGTSYASREAD